MYKDDVYSNRYQAKASDEAARLAFAPTFAVDCQTGSRVRVRKPLHICAARYVESVKSVLTSGDGLANAARFRCIPCLEIIAISGLGGGPAP